MSSHVFVFWIRLIEVDISEIDNQPKQPLIESNMLRVDDLELLYIYCDKVHCDLQSGTKKLSPEES